MHLPVYCLLLLLPNVPFVCVVYLIEIIKIELFIVWMHLCFLSDVL